MQEELTKYSDYYKGRHSGHKLDWDHSLGTATLKARFSAGVKELSVSLFQALVLLLFNESEDLPFGDIKEQTNMGAWLTLSTRCISVAIRIRPPSHVIFPSFVCIFGTIRRRRAPSHVAESCMWEEESAEEGARRKRCE